MADLNILLKIKELKQEAQDYFSITFEKPRAVMYQPGDWMDIRFPVPEFPVGKTYSFLTSPTERDVQIAFKKGVSKFKKALEQVKPGDTMLITQYGSNGFLFDKRYATVFIAGGIGIAPFRSMIKEAIDTNTKADIHLIYLNHIADLPFKHELDAWQQMSHYLKMQYVVTGQTGRLTKEKLQTLVPDITDRMNYVAGPPGMVTNIENMIQALGVNKEDIKTDSFDGY